MYQLEQYAKEKEDDKNVLKTMALLKLRNGEMDVETLGRVLDEIYKQGHYAGHCRGELSVRLNYNIGASKAV